MFIYALRRIITVVPTILAVVTLVFVVLRLTPGGPSSTLLGDNASAAAIAEMDRRLGLDRPIWEQYALFLGQLVRGDLGSSIFNGRPVTDELAAAFPYTFSLVIGTVLVGLLLGVSTGILTAVYRNGPVDYVGRVVSLIGLSVPEFYLAILLILLFSIQLGWFPFVGGGELSQPGDFIHRLILPSVTLGMIMSAFVSRTVRTAMLDVAQLDHVRSARAKGLRESRVIMKHVFRNALLPTVAFLGLYIAVLLGGAVIIEVVFSRRGWGRILVNAMKQRDYPMLQAGLMAFSALVVFVNVAVDLVYAWVDPRIRYT